LWQNGHVERLIGSIRRESLDHLIVLGEALRQIRVRAASGGFEVHQPSVIPLVQLESNRIACKPWAKSDHNFQMTLRTHLTVR
jgi:hypothetical protein